jgi:2-amino-4-hydroxy-6-hydroxymethyldihydropteridine diphosphokinase
VRVPVAIALGSNLGNRAAHLHWAVSRLREFVDGLVVSSFMETTPVGVKGQPDFLNGAVVGYTDLAPRDLLERLLSLEAERGRVRSGKPEPRTLDLDLILYGDQVINEPELIVPHPRFRECEFVVKPLAEIAPGLVDPKTGKRIDELAATF